MLLIFPRELIYLSIALAVTELLVNGVLLNFFLVKELQRLHCSFVWRKVCWVLLPFVFTCLFLVTTEAIEIDVYLKMGVMLSLITVAYLLQIKNIDNEALLLRLQILKYKILNIGRSAQDK